MAAGQNAKKVGYAPMKRQPPVDFPLKTKTEKKAGIERVLDERPAGEPFRIFAFGSLMWNPECTTTCKWVGTVHDHHRCFRIWTTRARGTPEVPGLGLCLEAAPGMTCTGLVLDLCENSLQQDLEKLWDREQHTGVYIPIWLDIETTDGAMKALTFVVNPEHALYAGHRTLEEMAERMAVAEGVYGPNREYVVNLIREMDDVGVSDPELVELADRIRAIRAAR